MSRTLTASDREALIRTASALDVGHPARRAILNGLAERTARGPSDGSILERVLEKANKLGDVDPGLAKYIMDTGLKDGDKADDKIPMGKASVAAGKLKPSQTTMRLDKTIGMAIAMLLGKMPLGGDLGAIISKDNHILDGHHRWSAAIAAGGPGVSVGGYKADLKGKDLLRVLNIVTKGMFNGRNGQPGKGNIGKYTPTNAKAALQKAVENGLPGEHPISPEDVQKALTKLGGSVEAGIEQMAENIGKMSKAVPSWAPDRKDMPVIRPKELPAVSKVLNTGEVNWNYPLSIKQAQALVRLAAALPVGSEDRKIILAGCENLVESKKKSARVKSKSESMRMMNDLRKKHGDGTKAYYQAVMDEVKAGVIAPSAVVGGGYKNGKKVAIEWLEGQMKGKQASDKAALLRLAATLPVGSEDRKIILAGCEKLPEGPMRDNCEKSKKDGVKPGKGKSKSKGKKDKMPKELLEKFKAKKKAAVDQKGGGEWEVYFETKNPHTIHRWRHRTRQKAVDEAVAQAKKTNGFVTVMKGGIEAVEVTPSGKVTMKAAARWQPPESTDSKVEAWASKLKAGESANAWDVARATGAPELGVEYALDRLVTKGVLKKKKNFYSKKAARRPEDVTVDTWLTVLAHKLTKHDRRLEKKQPNIYRLGHYLEAVDKLRKEFAGMGLLKDSRPDAFRLFQRLMCKVFTCGLNSVPKRGYALAPVVNVSNQIDAFLDSGKMPRL